MADPNRRRPDLLPLIVLIVIAGTVGLGIWLFPYASGFVDRQNCIASGRTDCG